eukprot:11114073-Alexandrium_andersonii.AAC.1
MVRTSTRDRSGVRVQTLLRLFSGKHVDSAPIGVKHWYLSATVGCLQPPKARRCEGEQDCGTIETMRTG